MAVSVGYELKDVSIETAWRCRIHLTLPADDPPNRLSAFTEEEEIADALYTLAGGKAELELPYVEEETLSLLDREHFNTLGPHATSAANLRAWRQTMERETQKIVRRRWDAILAVANELRDKGHLSHTELWRLLEGLGPTRVR